MRDCATLATQSTRLRDLAERYRLQRTAARLLWWARRRPDTDPADYSQRLWACSSLAAKYGERAPGVVAADHGEGLTGRYVGLVRCGSAWACPVCAASIDTRRSSQLTALLASWEAQGYHVSLLTLTLRHSRHEALPDVLGRLSRAYRRWYQRRAVRAWRSRAGVAGQVRSLEVIDGASGWHPHYHIAVVSAFPLERQDEIVRAWLACVKAEGGDALPAVAFDLRGGDSSAGEYLAKAGGAYLGLEVAGHGTKVAAGSSPADLLRRSGDGDKGAGLRWLEYYRATKGASRLQVSRSLGSLSGADEELAEEYIDPAEYYLARLGGWELAQLLREGRDHRAWFLAECEAGRSDTARAWLRAQADAALRRAIGRATLHPAPS